MCTENVISNGFGIQKYLQFHHLNFFTYILKINPMTIMEMTTLENNECTVRTTDTPISGVTEVFA